MGCIPARETFHTMAREANIIPVYREVIADIDTPVSALAKLGPGPSTFLLESIEGGERLGRYSFLGNSARKTFRARGRHVTVEHADGTITSETTDDPLGRLEQLLSRFKPAEVPGLPRFYGGAVGYVGFDGIVDVRGGVEFDSDEEAPEDAGDETAVPDIMFLITDAVLIFDHVQRKIQVVVNANVQGDADEAYDEAVARIDDIVRRLQKNARLKPLSLSSDAASANGSVSADGQPPVFQTNVAPEEFYDAVTRARDKVRAGDVYQVVLSVRLTAALKAVPFNIYRLLRSVNPSPYMFYFDFGSLQLVGSSPEVMVRLEDGQALLRPIAGTRRRGATAADDDVLAEDLLADGKERAEHVMLVDLGRSDLGRVCEYGTVRLDEWMTVEKYSHVMHIVSNVRGDLAEGRSAFDLLKATFPAGTVSGAPKTKALEL